MAAKKKPAGKAATWTRNRTGKQPVSDGVWVEVRLRSGEIERSPADEFNWNKGLVDQEVMAWRRVRKPRQPKAEPIPHEVMAVATGLGVPAAQVADDLAAEPVRHFDRTAAEPADDTLLYIGDRVWVSVACPVAGAGGQHGTVVDILAHDQGYHVALENGSDPVIASEYLHPSTPPRHSEQEEHGRQYIWGVVAVCVMILAGIGVLMTGLVP